MYVCVCVTERDRETHKERETQAEIEKNIEREGMLILRAIEMVIIRFIARSNFPLASLVREVLSRKQSKILLLCLRLFVLST